MKVISPVAWGSGAFIIHKILERYLPQYKIISYNPKLTLVPLSLLMLNTASLKNADLIHTTPDYAWFFYRKSIPMIITFHNYVLDNWMRPYSSFMQKLHYATDLKIWTKLAVKNARKITAVSHYTADLVKHDMKLSTPIQVLYNGIDTTHFRPKRESRNSQKEIRVFFSGNLTRRKGAHWLRGIAKNLAKNIKIYYTQGLQDRGHLPYAENLHSVGAVPYENMPSRYRQMDILLMPTVREGFGLAVAEAMACGLPIVASDCSAIPELVKNTKGGFLCPVGDVRAFAEKINVLADSPTLRIEMGEYNRRKVEENFTLEKMIAGYQNLFESVLDSN